MSTELQDFTDNRDAIKSDLFMVFTNTGKAELPEWAGQLSIAQELSTPVMKLFGGDAALWIERARLIQEVRGDVQAHQQNREKARR